MATKPAIDPKIIAKSMTSSGEAGISTNPNSKVDGGSPEGESSLLLHSGSKGLHGAVPFGVEVVVVGGSVVDVVVDGFVVVVVAMVVVVTNDVVVVGRVVVVVG